jgi:hypothetical protein
MHNGSLTLLLPSPRSSFLTKDETIKGLIQKDVQQIKFNRAQEQII